MCGFYVGQRVVCVDDANSEALSVGNLYTVAAVFSWPARSGLDGEIVSGGVVLIEAKAIGLGFDARRFRPVVERKTDISIFKSMLNKTPEQVPA